MKRRILTIGALFTLCLCLTACKTNENTAPDQTASTPSATQLPNADGSRAAGVPPRNGQVTDGNGIIGDEDDLIYDNNPPDHNPVGNAVGNAGDVINNAADNLGNTVSNITSNAGNIVSNAASNVGDTISNITDNAGNTVKNAADKISDTTDNR